MAKKEELKLFIWEEREMLKDSYMQWSAHLRGKVRKVVYKPVVRVDVHVADICNKQLVGKMVIDVVGRPGTFIIRGVSHGKTKTHFKWVRLAKVLVRQSRESFEATVIPVRVQRYWFWREVKKSGSK